MYVWLFTCWFVSSFMFINRVQLFSLIKSNGFHLIECHLIASNSSHPTTNLPGQNQRAKFALPNLPEQNQSAKFARADLPMQNQRTKFAWPNVPGQIQSALIFWAKFARAKLENHFSLGKTRWLNFPGEFAWPKLGGLYLPCQI